MISNSAYYYHQLKYFFSETFDDVILDLRVDVPASAEGIFSNACYSVRYVDDCHGIALVKGTVSDARHTVGYVDAGQGSASVEGAVSNARHTVRYVDAGKRFTPVEGTVSYTRHTVWYVDVGQRFTLGEFTSRFISTICVSNGRKVTRKYIRIAEKIKI